MDLRVKFYLGRIRLLRLGGKDEWEHALLPILVAWFGKEPLLPNLKKLVVSFIGDFPTSYNFIPLILPPGLETIETSQVSGSQCSAAMVNFYYLLLPACRSLQNVDFSGQFSPYLLPALTSFKKLVYLKLSHPRNTVVRRTSPFSLPELLQQLTSLKCLFVDLGTLPVRTPTPPTPLECHSLRVLQLSGTAEEIRVSLSSKTTCSGLGTLGLIIRSGRDLPWVQAFDNIVSNFPTLNYLFVSAAAAMDLPELVMSDLQVLLSLRMTRLVLFGVQNSLSHGDLQSMAKAWPNLLRLTLTGCRTCFDARTLFTGFPFPALHMLALPLDFTTFTLALRDPSVTRKNKLHYLRLCSPTTFPPTLKEKIALMRNLLAVSPHLTAVTVESGMEGIAAETQDLQDILTGICNVVATHGP